MSSMKTMKRSEAAPIDRTFSISSDSSVESIKSDREAFKAMRPVFIKTFERYFISNIQMNADVKADLVEVVAELSANEKITSIAVDIVKEAASSLPFGNFLRSIIGRGKDTLLDYNARRRALSENDETYTKIEEAKREATIYFESLVSEVAYEASRIFEYQICNVGGKNEEEQRPRVQKLAQIAVMKIFSVRSKLKLKFTRNDLLQCLLASNKGNLTTKIYNKFKRVVFGKGKLPSKVYNESSKTYEWETDNIFSDCGLVRAEFDMETNMIVEKYYTKSNSENYKKYGFRRECYTWDQNELCYHKSPSYDDVYKELINTSSIKYIPSYVVVGKDIVESYLKERKEKSDLRKNFIQFVRDMCPSLESVIPAVRAESIEFTDDCSNSNFSGCDLTRINISLPNLNKGNMKDSNFDGANMMLATITNFDLSDTFFVDTDLRFSKLTNIDLSSSKITDAMKNIDISYSQLNNCTMPDEGAMSDHKGGDSAKIFQVNRTPCSVSSYFKSKQIELNNTLAQELSNVRAKQIDDQIMYDLINDQLQELREKLDQQREGSNNSKESASPIVPENDASSLAETLANKTETSEDQLNLIKMLNNSPEAITRAYMFMRLHNKDIKEYLTLYETYAKNYQSKTQPELTVKSNNHDTDFTLAITYDFLITEHPRLAEILKMCSFMEKDNIFIEIFLPLFYRDYKDLLKAFAVLQAYGLVRNTIDSEGRVFASQSFIQESIRDKYIDNGSDLLKEVLDLINNALSSSSSDDVKALEDMTLYVKHAKRALETIKCLNASTKSNDPSGELVNALAEGHMNIAKIEMLNKNNEAAESYLNTSKELLNNENLSEFIHPPTKLRTELELANLSVIKGESISNMKDLEKAKEEVKIYGGHKSLIECTDSIIQANNPELLNTRHAKDKTVDDLELSESSSTTSTMNSNDLAVANTRADESNNPATAKLTEPGSSSIQEATSNGEKIELQSLSIDEYTSLLYSLEYVPESLISEFKDKDISGKEILQVLSGIRTFETDYEINIKTHFELIGDGFRLDFFEDMNEFKGNGIPSFPSFANTKPLSKLSKNELNYFLKKNKLCPVEAADALLRSNITGKQIDSVVRAKDREFESHYNIRLRDHFKTNGHVNDFKDRIKNLKGVNISVNDLNGDLTMFTEIPNRLISLNGAMPRETKVCNVEPSSSNFLVPESQLNPRSIPTSLIRTNVDRSIELRNAVDSKTVDLDLIRTILRTTNTCVDAVDKIGLTALMKASVRNHVGAINVLLDEFNADVDLADKDGNTALIWACSKGYAASASILIEHNADVNKTNNELWSPLMKASFKGSSECVKILLRTSNMNPNLQNTNGNTALMLATSNNRSDVVELLIGYGARVLTKNNNNETALSIADDRKYAGILGLLQNTQEVKEWKATLKQEEDRKLAEEEVAKTLVKVKVNRGKDLRAAARTGNYSEIVKILDSSETPVDDIDETDTKHYDGGGTFCATALILASRYGHDACVRLLLDRNASIEARDHYGSTPLIWAAYKGHEKVVSLLIDKGASIEARDKDGGTPLICAAYKGHEKVVSLLIDKGASIEARHSAGWTPLINAAYKGHEKVVSLLIDKGADIEASSKDGSTPLICAAYIGHEKVVALLIDKGADIEASSKYGYTPLIWAIRNRKADCVKMLLTRGASKSARDKDGKTALDYAIERGYGDIKALLS